MENKTSVLKAGVTLATLDGDRYTNAVVKKVDEKGVHVVTDFGNSLLFSSESEVFIHFKVSQFYKECLTTLPTDMVDEMFTFQRWLADSYELKEELMSECYKKEN